MSENVEEKLDQFFTKKKVAEYLIEKIDFDQYDIIIEPSAGKGDFFKSLPQHKRIGVDVEPHARGLVKMDFLLSSELTPLIFCHPSMKNCEIKILTIGNPPFGKNSSIARKFFNRVASFSSTIAFILPRTFRKPSVQNYLNKNFHLIHDELLELDSFYVFEENKKRDYKVPTVFQMWEKKEFERENIPVFKTCEDFDFVSPSEGDFSLRRVGGAAGTIFDDCDREEPSHYFIKSKSGCSNVKNILNSIEWTKDGPKYDTIGYPSVSKNDLIKGYLEKRDHE